MGAKLWDLRSDEVEALRKCQRYVLRRYQRFPKKSPNHRAYTPLGWMSLDRLVQVKKLMFLRKIFAMEDDDTCKRILVERSHDFVENPEVGRRNEFCSPIYDILNISIHYVICMSIIQTVCYFSIGEWKKLVWEKVWSKEDDDCVILYKQPHQSYILFNVTEKPCHLVWWLLVDMHPEKIRMCKVMDTLVCDTSLLKSTDYQMKERLTVIKCV